MTDPLRAEGIRQGSHAPCHSANQEAQRGRSGVGSDRVLHHSKPATFCFVNNLLRTTDACLGSNLVKLAMHEMRNQKCDEVRCCAHLIFISDCLLSFIATVLPCHRHALRPRLPISLPCAFMSGLALYVISDLPRCLHTLCTCALLSTLLPQLTSDVFCFSAVQYYLNGVDAFRLKVWFHPSPPPQQEAQA